MKEMLVIYEVKYGLYLSNLTRMLTNYDKAQQIGAIHAKARGGELQYILKLIYEKFNGNGNANNNWEGFVSGTDLNINEKINEKIRGIQSLNFTDFYDNRCCFALLRSEFVALDIYCKQIANSAVSISRVQMFDELHTSLIETERLINLKTEDKVKARIYYLIAWFWFQVSTSSRVSKAPALIISKLYLDLYYQYKFNIDKANEYSGLVDLNETTYILNIDGDGLKLLDSANHKAFLNAINQQFILSGISVDDNLHLDSAKQMLVDHIDSIIRAGSDELPILLNGLDNVQSYSQLLAVYAKIQNELAISTLGSISKAIHKKQLISRIKQLTALCQNMDLQKNNMQKIEPIGDLYQYSIAIGQFLKDLLILQSILKEIKDITEEKASQNIIVNIKRLYVKAFKQSDAFELMSSDELRRDIVLLLNVESKILYDLDKSDKDGLNKILGLCCNFECFILDLYSKFEKATQTNKDGILNLYFNTIYNQLEKMLLAVHVAASDVIKHQLETNETAIGDMFLKRFVKYSKKIPGFGETISTIAEIFQEGFDAVEYERLSNGLNRFVRYFSQDGLKYLAYCIAERLVIRHANQLPNIMPLLPTSTGKIEVLIKNNLRAMSVIELPPIAVARYFSKRLVAELINPGNLLSLDSIQLGEVGNSLHHYLESAENRRRMPNDVQLIKEVADVWIREIASYPQLSSKIATAVRSYGASLLQGPTVLYFSRTNKFTPVSFDELFCRSNTCIFTADHLNITDAGIDITTANEHSFKCSQQLCYKDQQDRSHLGEVQSWPFFTDHRMQRRKSLVLSDKKTTEHSLITFQLSWRNLISFPANFLRDAERDRLIAKLEQTVSHLEQQLLMRNK